MIFLTVYSNLTRFPSKTKNNWHVNKEDIASPMIIHLNVARPLRDMSNLFLNMFTLLAFTQSIDKIDNQSFIVICENEYFLISNLHCIHQ